MKEGHIWIDDQISNETYDQVKKDIASHHDKEKIVVHIASPGGSVYAGYKIYNALKLSGKKIKTIVEGEAQSMASFIAIMGDEVEICNPSVFMMHMPHSGIEGTAEQFIQGASELQTIENDMIAAYAAKSKKSPEEIREMMRKTTTLNAQQAKDMGFADKVLKHYLQAVALGQTIKKPMEKKETILNKIIKMAADAITGTSPAAVDLKTKDGKMLHIESEDGELPGKPATIDGQPATGTYMLEDGRSVVCENGVVTSVQEASAQSPTPAQPDRQAALEAELAKIKAEKAAAEAAKIEAEKKAGTAIQALTEVKKEVEAMKKTIGSDEPPATPVGPVALNAQAAKQRDETMAFLFEYMPFLRNHYPEKEVEKYVFGPKAVSILETSFNYTYLGILTTDIFYKPTLQAPALADMFTIDQDIKFQKRYNLVTQLDKILKPYTGCTRTFNNNRQLITNTTVTTKEFNVAESWCKDDFTSQLTGAYNFLAQEWLKTGNNSFDPSGTPIAKIIDRVLKDALQRDVWRRFSFAAGNSSDDDYNQFDGLWDRLIDSSGASNYCVVRGATIGTGALSAGNSLTHLESVYANSNILLKNAPNKKFFVTRSIWDNLYNSYIGSGTVTEAQFENLQKGLTTLTYKGIPVIPIDLWDVFLAESDNPLFGTAKHLILLTIKENHIAGVENGADLNKIEGWYERKDRKFYYEADMKLGYNYLHCDLQTIGY